MTQTTESLLQGDIISQSDLVVRYIYKKTPEGDLAIYIHFPPGWTPQDQRAAIMFFFGGGWRRGRVEQFQYQAEYLASRGMVAAYADYRTQIFHGTTPDKCIEDGKSAIRWLRTHTASLGIDSERIAASGNSSGGNIAACTYTAPGLEAKDEDLSISSRPNLLVLFNPTLDVSDSKHIERIGSEELARDLSPNLNLTQATPPTILFYGTRDSSLADGKFYLKKARELGVKAHLYLAEGMGHGFFSKEPWLNVTLEQTDRFLATHGYLQGNPAICVSEAAKLVEWQPDEAEETKDTEGDDSINSSVRLAVYELFSKRNLSRTQPKVFGIGLSRTGISSLWETLNRLDMETKYYDRDWTVQQELLCGGQLKLLSHYRGLVDGIAPFYRQLDRAYPGSKFILTVREKKSWLQSMNNLTTVMTEKVSWLDGKGGQLSDFLLYQLNYGLLEFDEESYWQAYQQHCQGVLDYFKERPSDLLVMDICGGDGWEKLGSFLEMSVPATPFPHSRQWKNLSRLRKRNEAALTYLELLIPGDCPFILVDDGKLEPRHRPYLPFLERDGQYWGLPPDDTIAIAELERLRGSGAQFIVFVWSAFWWFQHYRQFHEYLRSHFPCILENQRVVAYDLTTGISSS